MPEDVERVRAFLDEGKTVIVQLEPSRPNHSCFSFLFLITTLPDPNPHTTFIRTGAWTAFSFFGFSISVAAIAICIYKLRGFIAFYGLKLSCIPEICLSIEVLAHFS
jgi:hypothetical protein